MKKYLPALLLMVGCGQAFLPSPTETKVTPADIVGTWEYSADYTKTRIVLELKADGTFKQSIVRRAGGAPQIRTGAWALDGAHPRLTVLKPVFGYPDKDWILEEANWWIVESHQRGVKFAIFGAADDRDPDSCWEFTKVR